MIKISYNELKEMETIDNFINYSAIENYIQLTNNYWLNGVVKTKVKVWSSSPSICLRFFDKNNENIAGIMLWNGDYLYINDNYIEVIK